MSAVTREVIGLSSCAEGHRQRERESPMVSYDKRNQDKILVQTLMLRKGSLVYRLLFNVQYCVLNSY